MPSFHAHRIASAPGLELVRWGCDGNDPPRPREEAARTAVLIVPVRGRFVVRAGHGPTVLDPSRGLYLRAGARYTARHPDGGDVCLAITGPAIDDLDRGPVIELGVAAQLAVAGLGPTTPPLLAVETVAQLAGADPVAAAPAAGAADRTIAARIVAHVAEHYDRPISLADAAAAARVSPFHASRAFRRATGRTIHQALEEVRLRHALALLVTTRDPLAAIAIATGFANQGHLGNRFRRRFGASPGRVRRGAAPVTPLPEPPSRPRAFASPARR